MACGLCRRTAQQTEQGCVWEEVHMEGDSLCLPAAVALLRPWLNGSAAICFGPTYRERNCALPISVILVWIWLYKLYLLTTNTLPHWHWCKLGRAPLYAPHSGESRAAAPAKTSDYTNIYLMNKTEGVRWGLAAIKREVETVTSLGLISGRPCVTSEPPQPVNVCFQVFPRDRGWTWIWRKLLVWVCEWLPLPMIKWVLACQPVPLAH